MARCRVEEGASSSTASAEIPLTDPIRLQSEIGEDISEEALEKSIIKLVRQFEKAFNYNVTLQ